MRLSRALILCLLPLFLLLACAPKPHPLMRVGSNVWSGYEILYLARSLGDFDASNIRMVEMLNSSDVMRALRECQLEAAALTLDETLSLMAEGMDLRVVLVFDYSDGADALLARPGIATLSGLKDRRVGVESGAVGAVMLDAALKKAGLKIDDIDKISLTAEHQVSAYTDGMVDAIIAFEPNVSRLRQAGAHVLFDSSDIPGQIIDVLAVRADALPKQAANLRTLLAAHFAALAYLRAHPADAQARMAPRLGENVAQQFAKLHLPDLADNRHDLAQLNARAQELAEFMVQQGLLPQPIPTRGLASADYLPRTVTTP